MDQQMQRTYQADNVAVMRNRVLRNTYILLAISMLPTVLGAWVGVQFNFSLMASNPVIGLLLFLAIAFGFIYGINKFRNSGVGVALLLGFTFFMGLMLAPLLNFTLSAYTNGGQLIMTAFGGTAIIFAVMAGIATTSKRDFSNMGKMLFVGLIVLILASVANMFLHIPALQLTISAIAIVIFSGFLLVDVQRIVNGGETNYITATLAVYLDLINIFQNLLALLGFASGDRD